MCWLRDSSEYSIIGEEDFVTCRMRSRYKSYVNSV